jgi:co-chaperonin GroES (HSP10)
MIQAVNDKIIVEEMKRTQTKGGIIFPHGAGDPQGYGMVISVGEDVENIEEGNIIVFHQRGGQSGLIGKKLLRVLKYDEVYGILNDKDTLESLAEFEVSGVSDEGTVQLKEESRIIQSAGGL